jgi:hypothetical protein
MQIKINSDVNAPVEDLLQYSIAQARSIEGDGNVEKVVIRKPADLDSVDDETIRRLAVGIGANSSTDEARLYFKNAMVVSQNYLKNVVPERVYTREMASVSLDRLLGKIANPDIEGDLLNFKGGELFVMADAADRLGADPPVGLFD